ncbi:MAG TPA: DNA topoisomerase IV subunit A [Polyangia bacterium]
MPSIMSGKQLDLLEEDAKTPALPPTRGKGGGGGGKGGNGDGAGPTVPTETSLVDEAQRRYLNYAVSVITSRALPDVRDGLKPVQRRILFAMHSDLHLYPDARFRKCANIVGTVLGKYHPHGDTACYEAMVRLAQDFSVRYLLVEGHGNFGSLDGDAPAAYRYTEARLAPLAMELLDEIKEGTVNFRPNYDGTAEEPIVLPARVPQLLANGCAGIAVGMATNIPPHNLSEVCQAAVALIDNRKLECKDLLRYIKGPDFPTGGLCTNSKKDLREIYETGQGPIHLRGEWKSEETKKGTPLIVLTSIPYNVSKSDLVERIAAVIIDKKLPLLVDVRDESTHEVRIVLELKQGADPALVMAYLYKHTPIALSFHVNMTCLVPTQNREVAGPMRLNLLSILSEFLDFREEVVTRRFEFELAELRRRIHILQGFAIIFDALDEAIRIIRKSDGKADAAAKLIKRFGLDDVQTDAILELKLYKLARLEMQIILDELASKRTRAKEIETILKDKRKLWKVIRNELEEISKRFTDKRRTKIGGVGGDDVEFQAEDFILDEEVTVILSRDGWLKRVREVKDISTTRVREGDAVLTALRGSTKELMAIFSNFGSAYVLRINDVPASTGYGEPVQKLFNFRDGERVIAAYVTTGNGPLVLPAGRQIIAVTKHGYGFRLNPDPHRELSTRAGRRYAKVTEGDEVVNVLPFKPKQVMCIVTAQARAVMCMADEAAELANPGKGVTMIKVAEDDAVVGFGLGDPYGDEILTAELDNGKKVAMGPGHDEVTSRGGRGHTLARKGKVVRVTYPEPTQDPKQVN